MRFAHFASLLLLSAALLNGGCHAQQPPAAAGSAATASAAAAEPGTPLSPAMQRKVEVILRQKANLPPETTVHVGKVTPSEFPNYDNLVLTVDNEGRVSKPIHFLISKDGKTLAQITRFDMSEDPKKLVSAEGRPFRGGPADAPVLIVGFDDLECPYCARLHEEIFPALLQRYGEEVRIVYRDFPLEMHPWAMHAAVDTNCLAEQSNDGYWAEVDYIHGHAGEIGTDAKDPKAEKTLARATEQIDRLTREQGQSHKVDMAKLNSCIGKQDTSTVEASRKLGEGLNLSATPALFINGDKIEGAVSLEFLYGIIDQALRVAGVQPPPPYVAPKTPGAAGESPAGQ